mmetsp:Transcript_12227/g.29190  ORF Transcript_12227/g.29190 Transcript_12227/m.29190 type:complete len:202 (+) Transcript_12227:328-933(+)
MREPLDAYIGAGVAVHIPSLRLGYLGLVGVGVACDLLDHVPRNRLHDLRRRHLAVAVQVKRLDRAPVLVDNGLPHREPWLRRRLLELREPWRERPQPCRRPHPLLPEVLEGFNRILKRLARLGDVRLDRDRDAHLDPPHPVLREVLQVRLLDARVRVPDPDPPVCQQQRLQDPHAHHCPRDRARLDPIPNLEGAEEEDHEP